MIWIWLLTRNSHKWATGALDRYFAYVCAHCGVTTSAMVRTFGHGSGSNHFAAVRNAEAMADAFAYRATAAAACPACHALQPAIQDGFARAAKRVARRRQLRLPLAGAAAALALLLLAYPAVSDLRESVSLSLVAMSTAVAAGAFFFFVLSGNVQTPASNPHGVWFSRDPSGATHSWFPAQPGMVPTITQPAKVERVLGLVGFLGSAVMVIVGLCLWGATFRKVYVVSAEGTALTMRLDDGPVEHVTQQSGKDAPFATLEVRTSRTHHLTVTGRDGRTTSYDLDPKTAKNGWLLAPQGHQHGLCVASLTWYYGTTPKDDGKLLNKTSDLVVLPYSFDYVLAEAPSSLKTDSSSSATRTTLRALDCDALIKDDRSVPYNTLPHDGDR